MEMVYMLAPDKLAGLSCSFNGASPLVQDEYQQLPVIGAGLAPRPGTTRHLSPLSRILFWKVQRPILRKDSRNLILFRGGCYCGEEETNYNDDALTAYANEITFLGELLGFSQSISLERYYKEAMSYVEKIVASIPDEEKVRVYYAEEGRFLIPIRRSIHTRCWSSAEGLMLPR
jgi:iron complex transport system substrate-binding protein